MEVDRKIKVYSFCLRRYYWSIYLIRKFKKKIHTVHLQMLNGNLTLNIQSILKLPVFSEKLMEMGNSFEFLENSSTQIHF